MKTIASLGLLALLSWASAEDLKYDPSGLRDPFNLPGLSTPTAILQVEGQLSAVVLGSELRERAVVAGDSLDGCIVQEIDLQGLTLRTPQRALVRRPLPELLP